MIGTIILNLVKKALNLLLCEIIFFLLIALQNPQTGFAASITNSWLSATPLPFQLASHIGYPYQNKLFVISGATTVTVPSNLSSNINSDGSLSPWINNLSSPSVYWAGSVVKNNYIYLIGGATNPITTFTDNVSVGIINSSGIIDTWRRVTSLPKPLASGAAVEIGNRIYFAGGFNENGQNSSIYSAVINESDGSLGSWTDVGQLPESNSGFSMVAANNYLLIIGGGTPSGISDRVYRCPISTSDGSVGSCQLISSLPVPIARSGVVKFGSTLISAGGVNTQVIDKVYYTQINDNGTLQPWQTSANSLPHPVCCGATALIGDTIYLTGGFDGNSYLNSVYFTKINSANTLSVPMFKQNAQPWKNDVYDSANLWSPADPTIGGWGCAMTSAVMVFNYYGITKLPDGQALNPRTLNSWMKNQPDGYVNGGWVNWLALSRLSKLAKQSGNNNGFKNDALEYSRAPGADKTILTNDLKNKIPGILELPGHFVVATGIKDNTFTLNDPLYNRSLLTDNYNNTFLNLGRYTPSSTDLSYLMLVSDENTSISVKDASGKTVGEEFIQQPLENENNTSIKNSKPARMYYLPKPADGKYTVTLNSSSAGIYRVTSYLYDNNGNVAIKTNHGIRGQGAETYTISFNRNDSTKSNILSQVTYASIIQDIREAKAIKLISPPYADVLISILNSAENTFGKYKKSQESKFLTIEKRFLTQKNKKIIDPEISKILLEKVDQLSKSL